MAKYFYSETKQRILLLLLAGVALSMSGYPTRRKRVLDELPKAWSKIGRTVLRRTIHEFKYKRLVDFKEEKDGVVNVVLTKLGEEHAIRYNPEKISITKPARWDKKWRLVIFDVPEKKKQAREALRHELKKVGFKELQKSVWCFPYECEDVIDFIVELFEIRESVRILEVSKISHDADLLLHFGLS